MTNESLQRVLIWLLIVAVSMYLLTRLFELVSLLGTPLLIFGLAWLIALGLRPLVDRLERLSLPLPRQLSQTPRHLVLPRSMAVTLAYLLLLAILTVGIFSLVPVIGPQLTALQRVLPTSVDQINDAVSWIEAELARLGVRVDLERVLPPESLVQQATTIGTTVVQQSFGIAGGVFVIVVDLLLVLILSFYMSLDGPRLTARTLAVLPPIWRQDVSVFLGIVDRTFGGFLRAQVFQGVAYGLANAALMLIFGVSYVALSSVTAAILVLIPLIGPALAIIPPLIVALVQRPDVALWLVLGLLAVQQVLFNMVMPKFMGQIVGLHPLFVFAAILVGGALAGAWGILFGIPVAGVLASVSYFFFVRATGQRPAGNPVPLRTPDVEAVEASEVVS